ncbi:MAG: SH3 domain-containing protein [Butyrivibrio sp.]|uniref:SH3 domain-containing protein n=1 Tax=Butyrivibrio sp. TaxID=28121 RepID=UPI001B15E0E3|nr:SH3 domain-containing protein [Butyrivibrio sp.]MBO6242405.1 SH3 domain-containing protein [Butyrivibrio sp.]
MKKNKGKRIGNVVLSLIAGLVIFTGAGLTAFAYTETTGTVSQDNVKVRESASTTATQVSSLKIGDTIDIVDEETDASGYVWYKIRVNKSEYGYVRSDLVKKSGSSDSSTSTTTSTSTSTTTEANAAAASLPATTVTATDQKSATAVDNCKVRSGAGTGYEQVGNLTKGDSVTITGEATGTDSKTWYQITYGANAKTGFVRSDLLNIVETAPAETTETAESTEGDSAEAANAEVAEGSEGEETSETSEAEQSQEAETAQVGDGSFELKYEDDVWYLYDYEKGQRVQVEQLIEVAESVPTVTKQANTFKKVAIALGIAVAALIIGIIILALKLRDSLYYEDEEEDEDEEYDRYSASDKRRRGEDEDDASGSKRRLKADEEEEKGRRSFRRTSEESSRREAESGRTVRPSREDRALSEKASRSDRVSRRNTDDDRTVRPERNADDRASRRNMDDDRQARRSRRDEEDDRFSRRSEERASRRIRQAQEEAEDRVSASRRDEAQEESPRRRAKNFIGEDDDFEFEFLDLDD